MNIDDVRLNFAGDSIWILNGILALIMFGIAVDLKPSDFRRVLSTPKGPLIGLASQFILLPAFTFLLTLILRPAPSIALGMILMAACPGGTISNFMTHFARGNTALSLTMTAISTIAAIVMTPLNLSMWGYLHPATRAIMTEVHINPIQVFLTIMLILGVPLTVGMLFKHGYPNAAERLHTPFKYGSMLFFIAFVVYLLHSNWAVFSRYLHWVLFAVLAHNTTALILGYTAAKSANLPAQDCRAISLEVGIQNGALGLALIFAFFDGLGGMAMVAGAWGIWHIVSGLTLAWLWSLRPVHTPQTAEAEAEA